MWVSGGNNGWTLLYAILGVTAAMDAAWGEGV
jgi:hypothetical protein